MSKIMSGINQKGRVGKTITAVKLGIGLRFYGKNLLVVVMDLQTGVTSTAGLKNQVFKITYYYLLRGNALVEQAELFYSGISSIPYSFALSSIDIELVTIPGRELLIKEALPGIFSLTYRIALESNIKPNFTRKLWTGRFDYEKKKNASG